ncbi:hypothetical protein QRD02_07415 [Aequorivita sp. SDUM287046]|uniref:Uncharacterized protein n=1 Tax=Aequorivita aurantiaca TaxID=3053356 RepID=A0ABT8DJT6_9FLAO|nr:hypothetical protein [Aequorivita aurantiaca]MDN3724206.1 hypothetical protein [Aequorivita aurantiaca]
MVKPARMPQVVPLESIQRALDDKATTLLEKLEQSKMVLEEPFFLRLHYHKKDSQNHYKNGNCTI